MYNGKYVIELNLRRKWFDMILSGVKKTEYRKIGLKKIKDGTYDNFITYLGKFDALDSGDGFDPWVNIPYSNYVTSPEKCVLLFCNGYATDRDYFYIEFKGLSIDSGKKEWGAISDTKYFCLELGEILEKRLRINN
jgi:hypothetical protein